MCDGEKHTTCISLLALIQTSFEIFPWSRLISISWSETISWAVSTSFQLLVIEHHSKSPCFTGDVVPNDGKHGRQSVRLVLQTRVITFNLHPGSTGRENKSKDRLQINAWLHYVFLQQGFTCYSLTVSPMGSMCSQYTILRGHFSFGSRHPIPPSLTDIATTTGLPSGEIVITWLSRLYHARHSNK